MALAKVSLDPPRSLQTLAEQCACSEAGCTIRTVLWNRGLSLRNGQCGAHGRNSVSDDHWMRHAGHDIDFPSGSVFDVVPDVAALARMCLDVFRSDLS